MGGGSGRGGRSREQGPAMGGGLRSGRRGLGSAASESRTAARVGGGADESQLPGDRAAPGPAPRAPPLRGPGGLVQPEERPGVNPFRAAQLRVGHLGSLPSSKRGVGSGSQDSRVL
ncbi:unnamed protein product [Lepidochelys olivacea]